MLFNKETIGEMSTTSKTSKTALPRLRYHHNAYQFVFAALRHTQQRLGRGTPQGPEDEVAHISGRELLDGIRELALEQFGLLTLHVFHHWGVNSTADFGRIVFELVERGEMRKTERDQLSDFFDVYDFEDVFDRKYRVSAKSAFRR